MELVVRTKDQLQDSIDLLRKIGIQCEGLEISSMEYHRAELEGVDGIVVTSPSSLVCIPESRLPIFCVGKKTADEARKMGLRVVLEGEANGQDMAEKIVERFPAETLLHIAGDHAETEWYQILEKQGFTVKTQEVYSTRYLESLPQKFVDGLSSAKFHSCMLFSAKGAEAFQILLEKHNISPLSLTAICLSEKVSQPLKGFGCVQIADTMTMRGMVEALKTLSSS